MALAWPVGAQNTSSEPGVARSAFTTTVQRLPLANLPLGAEPGAASSTETAADASGLMAFWHWPRAAPLGLVLLQHGFTRRCGHLSGLAQRISSAGWAVLCIEANMAAGQPRWAHYLAEALRAGSLRGPRGQALPEPWVVAGHSAGGFFALNLAAELKRLSGPSQHQSLTAVLLFDAVAGRDDGFEKSLRSVLAAPALRVVAWPSRPGVCNAGNRGLAELLAASGQQPEAVTVHDIDPNSTHLDAEGADTDLLAVGTCRQGPPQAPNVERLENSIIEVLQSVRR